MNVVLSTALYFVALINPLSKVFLLSGLSGQMPPRELRLLSVRSSAVALGILLAFAAFGPFLLRSFFQVELYSFQVAGGVVLFTIGLKALMKGVFFEVEDKSKLADVSIVPLASPMIAGPGTITAVVSFSAQHGLAVASTAMVAAVIANLAVMLLSGPISRALLSHNLMGALIRITGLVVATIAVQMIFDGLLASGLFGALAAGAPAR